MIIISLFYAPFRKYRGPTGWESLPYLKPNFGNVKVFVNVDSLVARLVYTGFSTDFPLNKNTMELSNAFFKNVQNILTASGGSINVLTAHVNRAMNTI